MKTPTHLKYLASHQWGLREADGSVTVGITDYAQNQLGDVVFVDLPAIGSNVDQTGEAGIIESVKTASDLFAPVSGTVAAINPLLEETPEVVNEDPYGKGWLFRIQPANLDGEWDALLDSAGYEAAVTAEQDDD
jgi:glycine cleavage system H protein